MERELIKHYEHIVSNVLLPSLNAENYATAIKIAKIPEEIRGYDVVKDKHVNRARVKESELLVEFRNPPKQKDKAGVEYAKAV